MFPCRFALRGLLLGLAWAALGTRSSAAQALELSLAEEAARAVGGLSCASASCHGRYEPRRMPGAQQRQEFRQWLEHDPHARAGQRLFAAPTAERPGFSAMLDRLTADAVAEGRGPADQVRSEIAARCAACHDPVGLREAALAAAVSPGGRAAAGGHGIDCESCHGPARDWLAEHYRRDASPADLAARGMRDLSQPLARARACAACHVGGPERTVDHDMYAAGHPPLRFELTSYHKLLGRKHWDDAADRRAAPDWEAQLWSAGQFAQCEAELRQVAARAERAAAAEERNEDPPAPPAERAAAPWLDFAQYDCFACHQQLRPEAGFTLAPRDEPGRAGLPRWGRWNVAGAESAHDATALAELRGRLNASFAPPPAEVAAAAHAALARLRASAWAERLQSGSGGESAGAPLASAAALLRQEPTWERSAQALLALAASERTLRDRLAASSAGGADRAELAARSAELDAVRGRLAEAAQRLAFERADREWPQIVSPQAPGVPAALRDDLEGIRRDLAAWPPPWGLPAAPEALPAAEGRP